MKWLRLAVALVAAVGVFVEETNMVAAAGAFSLSVNYASGSSVLPAAKVNLVTEMPVAQQGTVTQEIVQTIDPTKLKLTGSWDVTYPSGWALSVSFDGSTFTSSLPTTSTGTATSWDKVVKVKAAGPIVSQGESNGYQIAEGSASGTPTTATPPTAPLTTAGDPYYSFFDAKRSMVFYIAHHTNGNILGCVVIATNTACNGAPYSIAGVGSDGYAVGKVINNRIWFPGSNGYGGLDGLACLDITSLVANPATGTPVNCGVYPEFNSIIANIVGGRAAQAEQQIWGFQWNTSKFICFDTATRASCGSISTAVPLARRYYSYVFQQWGDRLYAQTDTNAGATSLYCYVISTKAPCSGFPKAKSRMYGMFVLPNAQGVGVALCYLDSGNVCWDANGSAYSISTSVADMMAWTGSFVSTSGTRVLSASGSTYRCWDAKANTGTGGWCYASSSYSGLNYTVTQDPLLPECIWISADNGTTVSTRDMSTNTAGCGNATKKVLTLSGTTAVPRMACGTTGAGSIRAWRTLTLDSPSSSSYTAVTMSVATTGGVDIAGWQQVPVTSWPVDISTLDPVVTGSSPQFQLTFTGLSASVTSATVKISAVGDAPQLCVTPTSTLACPAVGSGLGYVSNLPTATTSSVSTSGAALDASNNSTSMGPVSQMVNLAAPAADQCGGQIRGTATMTGTSASVVGVTVNLLDSSGAVVRDASNNPITATTDANGSYSFGNLKPGNYKVSFGTNAGTSASATQYTDDGSGATGTNTANATSSTIAVAVTQTDVVNATYPAPIAPTADTTTGGQGVVQTIDLTLNDVPSTGATLTKSSVYLCDVSQSDSACRTAASRTKVVAGVGTYAVNATTGVMTFTPCSGVNTPVMSPACTGAFVGTPSALKYVISDSAGNTGSSTYTPTVIAAPVATADSSSGARGAAQTINPLANDVAGTGATLAATSVKLCTGGDVAPNCTGTSKVVAGQGVYTVNGTTGELTFTPCSAAGTPSTAGLNCTGAFTGTATAATYSVTDSVGQKASTTYTPTVVATPTTTADSSSGAKGAAQSVNPLSNDAAGSGATLTASSVRLCDGADVPPNCTATSKTVSGQGTYSVNVATGALTFTPLANFTGAATAVTYSVTDSVGQKASTTYTPTVVDLPAATADTSTGLQGATQTVNPLSNDAAGTGGTLTATSVKLCAGADVAPNCTATSKTIAGEGTYSVNGGTGAITFAPLANYFGVATPVTYSVTDSVGQKASNTYTPTVRAAPVATPDTTRGPAGVAQNINPLLNDTAATGETLTATTVRLCDGADVAPTCTATSKTITGQGVYSVDQTTGLITFTPDVGFTGTATSVTYAVTDSLGQKASTTYTPTVAAVPSAAADTSTGAQGVSQVINVLANDYPSSGQTLNATSVKLCDGTDVAPTCTATSKTMTGQGTYSVDQTTGEITFTPLSTFTGVATPVTYAVTDSGGTSVSSTITPTVIAAPAVTADTSIGPKGAAQSVNPLTNDAAATGATLSVGSVRLCDGADVAPNCAATTKTVAGQGTYAVNPTTGAITFTPEPTFTGAPTVVTYSVTDSFAQKSSTTYAPTVVPTPVAASDTSVGALGAAQSVNPMSNDSAGTGATLDPTGVRLCGPTDTAPNCSQTSLTVTGEGIYAVNPTTGMITFTPDAGFTGVATAATYSIFDDQGQRASSTYTPRVVPPPTSTADTSTGGQGVAQSVSPLTNDAAGTGATLSAPSVRLCDGSDVAPNCTATSKVVAGQGTYAVNPTTGAITFTPEPTFTGAATAVTYSVADSVGQKTSTTYTPTVVAVPTATADTSSGLKGAAQTVNPLTNDAAGSGATLTAGSVRLCDGADVAPNCTATSKAMTVQGTYTVNTTTGEITFTPFASYVGAATPVTYAVTDSVGQKTSTTYTPTVLAIAEAQPDSSRGLRGVAQTLSVLTNDSASQSATLVATSVRLCDGTDIAPNCTALSKTVAGEGTYTVDATTGVITFTPQATFVGVATPVTYSVVDSASTRVSTTLTPTVVPPPTATADTTRGAKGAIQSVNPLANDTAGTGTTLDPMTVRLCASGEAVPNCTALSVTVAGQGVFSVTATTGVITFTPEGSFVGVATPIPYAVTDSQGQNTSSTYTPTVVPPPPTLQADTSSGVFGAKQSVNPLTNDAAGASATLDPASVKLCGTGEAAPNCSKTTVTVPGEGTYVVGPTGEITFTPDASFTGTATPVTYSVMDSYGQSASSTFTPTVKPPLPTMAADTSKGTKGSVQSVNPLNNDKAGTGTTLDPTSVKLCGPGETSPNCSQTSLTIQGEGTYSVNKTTGEITFTPDPSFTGTATPVTYSVADMTGQRAASTYTPSVNAQEPVLAPDKSSGTKGAIQTFNPLANDTASSGAALDPTTVRLCGKNETPPKCTQTSLTVAGQGTYVVNKKSGLISFIPLDSFVGTAAVVKYSVSDALGQKMSSTIQVKVSDSLATSSGSSSSSALPSVPITGTAPSTPLLLTASLVGLGLLCLETARRTRCV